VNRKPAILILAGGASSRMRGADKLLELVDGTALLHRITEMALATGARVIVALPPASPARRAALQGLAAQQVEVADASLGMSASIRAGVRAARGSSGVMILPADMPGLEADDLALLIAAFDQQPLRIWRATSADGRPGHPVIFPADMFADLAALAGDTGARPVLLAHASRLSLIALPQDHAITDLDTPEAWALWRAQNPGR
jgi:molybdenum cofactor cytidylyltransferase